ncbi:MAG: methyltransferase domain-containing protein [Chloroflexi bacterium]|nr:methyltransferase domain-containing protein [Chloroflexota bacterium]
MAGPPIRICHLQYTRLTARARARRSEPAVAREDRERWNARYAERGAFWDPSRWLETLGERLRAPHPGARALDVACGPGRNAIWLAERGYDVDAWDLSDEALALLRAQLDERAAAGQPLSIHPRQVDLDSATIPPGTYALIANVYFLDRQLFPQLERGLAPGGLLVFETFVAAGRTCDRGVSPGHSLRPGELRAAFPSLDVLEYQEDAERGKVGLLARRPEAI